MPAAQSAKESDYIQLLYYSPLFQAQNFYELQASGVTLIGIENRASSARTFQGIAVASLQSPETAAGALAKDMGKIRRIASRKGSAIREFGGAMKNH